jgi:UDPglucose 6-dehydrogenase
MQVGFIGLGKLGMPCAEAMATKHTVHGYDIRPVTSDSVIVKNSVQQVVEKSELIFIAVETPHTPEYGGSEPSCHLPNKDFDYSVAKSVLTEVNKYADKSKLVVLISTVLPGTTRNELIQCIPNARFVYNPYLIAMGSVAWDMVNPEMVMIGTQDGSETGDAKILIDFYKTIMQNDPRYIVGTWDECEAIKVFYNTFISAKIGLVNMIQDVALKNGNINVDVVTDALANSTMRIMGPKYMTAGMGDAGACHPRDNIALRYMAEKLDLGYDLFDAIMGAREIQAKNLADELVKHAKEHSLDVIIHGKAYKPKVPYCIGSYSMLVGFYVKEAGVTVRYIDPMADDPTDVIDDYDFPAVVLMAHNADITYDYADIDKHQDLYYEIKPGSIVVDPWRQFTTANENIQVIHYGNTRIV